MVLGLAEVVSTLACLMGGKVEIKFHPVSFLAQVDKEPGVGGARGNEIRLSDAQEVVKGAIKYMYIVYSCLTQ